MEYTALVRIIEQCKPLYAALQNVENKTGALNLVTEDWRTKLHQSEVYQQHITHKVKYGDEKVVAKGKAKNKYILNNSSQYNILVAGEWTLSKNESEEKDAISFVCRECDPLAEIGKSMQESTDSIFHTGARIFIESCDPYFCFPCSSKFREFSIPFAKKQWCVTTTQVFDGSELRNEFCTLLQKSLSEMPSFHAILRIRVKSKTQWANYYKIMGSTKEMIIFQPWSLVSMESLNFMAPEPTPQIEFPQEEEYTAALPNKKSGEKK